MLNGICTIPMLMLLSRLVAHLIRTYKVTRIEVCPFSMAVPGNSVEGIRICLDGDVEKNYIIMRQERDVL